MQVAQVRTAEVTLATGARDDVITLPVMLVALLRMHSFNVTLYRSRERGDLWWFRMNNKSVLQMTDDGVWRWHRRIGPMCGEVESLIAEAERRLKAEGEAR